MKRFFSICCIALIIALSAAVSSFGAPERTGTSIQFEILKGEGVNTISKNLKEKGLIKSSFIFESYVWFIRADHRVKAGVYTLRTDTKLTDLVTVLLTGDDRASRRVTLIEGWSLREYRTYLVEHGFDVKQFDEVTKSTTQWEEQYTFLTLIPSKSTLEGYLFPDTYEVDTERSLTLLIGKMLSNFDAKVTAELRAQIVKNKRTLHETIIMASILEEEVRSTEDRRKVADIFYRRLAAGIGLQSDATINYITASGRARSTDKDRAIDSPYNTYKYRGLPPGPIGNPGLNAIESAINPLSNAFFYFLTDAQGTVHYAKTLAEHARNRELYLAGVR